MAHQAASEAAVPATVGKRASAGDRQAVGAVAAAAAAQHPVDHSFADSLTSWTRSAEDHCSAGSTGSASN